MGRLISAGTDGMKPGEGELGTLFLEPILASQGAHPKTTLKHQSLPRLYPVVKVLGQIAPTHYFQQAGGITRPQPIKLQQ